MKREIIYGLLMTHDRLTKRGDRNGFASTVDLKEGLKICPLGDVWDDFCENSGVPVRSKWLDDVKRYENDVLFKRK